MILYPKHDVFSLLGTGPRPGFHFFLPRIQIRGFFVDPQHIPMYFTMQSSTIYIIKKIYKVVGLFAKLHKIRSPVLRALWNFAGRKSS